MLRVIPSQLPRQLFLAFAAVLVVPWLAILIATLAAYTDHLEPEATRRLQVIGRTVAAPLERAFAFGIPFNELQGMDPFLDQVMEENPSIYSLSLTPPDFVRGATRRYERVNPGADPGRSTQLLIQQDGRTMGILRIAEKASTAEQLYWAAVSDLLVALLVALIGGFHVMRCLLGLMVTEPLRLAEGIVEAASGGDLTRVAGSATMGGEIGGLLAAINRLVRRTADRFEDVTIYAREVRTVVSDAAAPANIDRLIADLGRRVRMTASIAEAMPQHARPLHEFAGFLAVVALILQLPPLARWGQGIGPWGEATILAGALVAVLVPGRLWDAATRNLGRRSTLLVGVCLALLPVLSPVPRVPAGTESKLVLLAALLPWFAAMAGLAGMLRQGAWESRGGGNAVVGLAMPGAACGCGLIAVLPQSGVVSILAACLTLATFLLLLPRPSLVSGALARTSGTRLDVPGLVSLLMRVPAAPAAGMLLLLAHLSLFGIAAAILPGGADGMVNPDGEGRWAMLALYAAAAVLGGVIVERIGAGWRGAVRWRLALWLMPGLLGAALLLLAATVVSPGTLLLVPLGLATGAAVASAEGWMHRVTGTVRSAAAQGLAGACGTLGVIAGLLLGTMLTVGDALLWLGLLPLAAVLVLAAISRAVLFTGHGLGREG